MDVETNFITLIMTRINTLVVRDLVYKSWSAFTSDARGLISLFLTILILVYALQAMLNPRGFSLNQALKSLVIALLACGLLTQWGVFSFLIVDPALKLPSEFAASITRAITRNPSASSYAGLDELWRHGLSNIQLLLGQAGFSGAGVGFVATALIYAFFLFLCVGVSVALLVIAQTLVALLLFIAPIMVPFMIFPVTRGVFLKWVHVTVGLGLTQVLVVACLVFLMAIVEALSLAKGLVPGEFTLTFAMVAADCLILIVAVFAFIMSFAIGLQFGTGVGPAATAGINKLITRVVTVNLVK
jgi:type IV secretory pathway VirB6-like protein